MLITQMYCVLLMNNMIFFFFDYNMLPNPDRCFRVNFEEIILMNCKYSVVNASVEMHTYVHVRAK